MNYLNGLQPFEKRKVQNPGFIILKKNNCVDIIVVVVEHFINKKLTTISKTTEKSKFGKKSQLSTHGGTESIVYFEIFEKLRKPPEKLFFFADISPNYEPTLLDFNSNILATLNIDLVIGGLHKPHYNRRKDRHAYFKFFVTTIQNIYSL